MFVLKLKLSSSVSPVKFKIDESGDVVILNVSNPSPPSIDTSEVRKASKLKVSSPSSPVIEILSPGSPPK